MPKGVAVLVKNFWHIPVISESQEKKITDFRVKDVGRRGRSELLIGKTESGRWIPVSWHIHKNTVKVERGTLVSYDPADQKILDKIKKDIGKIKASWRGYDVDIDSHFRSSRRKHTPSQGWRYDSSRHSLARKGIKTGRKRKKRNKPSFGIFASQQGSQKPIMVGVAAWNLNKKATPQKQYSTFNLFGGQGAGEGIFSESLKAIRESRKKR